MEAKWCPYCQSELKALSDRSNYCEKCRAVVQISVEITNVNPPLLKKE